jgi:hypothetical protein
MKWAAGKLLVLTSLLMGGCANKNAEEPGQVDENKLMVFSPQLNLISDDFDGLGVEWGAYEDINKLQVGAWDRIEKYADHLEGMSLVRCMVNYDWFVENLYTKATQIKQTTLGHIILQISG